MIEHTSKTTLVDHLEEKTAAGLVDIKFYVHRNGASISPEVVLNEAENLFNAIACGHTEAFRFEDSRASRAMA